MKNRMTVAARSAFQTAEHVVALYALNRSWTCEHSVHSDKGAPNMLCFLCILKVNGVKMLRPVRGKRMVTWRISAMQRDLRESVVFVFHTFFHKGS